MARLLLLSNGHGEDLSGSLLGQRLQELGHDVQALPLAGLGQPYQRAGIELLGSSHEFTTGGIGYTSLKGRLTELVQGHMASGWIRLAAAADRCEQSPSCRWRDVRRRTPPIGRGSTRAAPCASRLRVGCARACGGGCLASRRRNWRVNSGYCG